ncbi:hypothetical protein IL306_001555 [Fusarium sp. DS 682]|nr:hypothetical protein IL306_001555 [Fusarium sp. DS 682]
MIGFVVADDNHSVEQEETGNQVKGWQDHFKSGMYSNISTAVDQSAIGNDFKGWISIYDGSEINKYFPIPEYLTEVVETLVRIPGIKRIFLGDIRSYAINRYFLAARAIHTLGNNATKQSVRQKIAELEDRKEELLVEPAFFTTLQDRLPDLVKYVKILLKNMKATNELSAYRYAAVIHLHDDSGESTQPVYSIEKSHWIDFDASRMNRDALLDLLRLSKNATTVAVSNIPYDKTAFVRQIVKSLDNDSKDETQSALDGPAWISAVRSEAEGRLILSVPELF